MPKLFEFYGGPPSYPGVSQALAMSVEAELAGARLKLEGTRDFTAGLTRGFEMVAERRARERATAEERSFAREMQGAQFEQQAAQQRTAQEFEAEQARIARLQRAQEFETSTRIGSQQARLDLIRSLGVAGIGAGLEPGATIERTLSLGQEALGPAEAAGGYGNPLSRILQSPMGQDEYKKLIGGRDPVGFEKIPMVPQEPSEGDKKRQDENMISQAVLDLQRYRMGKGKKELVNEESVTLADYFGWGSLDEFELEQTILANYPELRPRVPLDGKEDRRALDARIKLFTKEHKIEVENGPAIAALRQSGLEGNTYEPRILDEALGRVYGDKAPPMTPQEQRQAALQKLGGQFPEYTLRVHPPTVGVQAPSFKALIEGEEERRLVTNLGGEAKPFILTKEALTQIGLSVDQLPRSILSAASLSGQGRGYQLMAAPDGRLIAVPPGSDPIDPRLQKDIDAQLNDPTKPAYQRVRAYMELDPTQKQTPAEVQEAGAMRGILQGAGAQKAEPQAGRPTTPRTAKAATPEREPAPPSTPASSALARCRARKQAEKQAKKPGNAKPPEMAAFGLPASAMLALPGGPSESLLGLGPAGLQRGLLLQLLSAQGGGR